MSGIHQGLIFIERKDNDVAQSSSAAHQLASRYAGALIDTAESAKTLDSVEKDMADLNAMLSGSDDLQKLISSPAFGAAQQQKAVQALADASKFSKESANLLQLLIHNGRLNILANVIAAFNEKMAARRGEVKAEVRTAVALSESQMQELGAQLKKSLGHTVQLDVKVDPSILGGMIVTVGSRQMDDSVRTKLARLKQTLTSSNQNNVLKEVG